MAKVVIDAELFMTANKQMLALKYRTRSLQIPFLVELICWAAFGVNIDPERDRSY